MDGNEVVDDAGVNVSLRCPQDNSIDDFDESSQYDECLRGYHQ